MQQNKHLVYGIGRRFLETQVSWTETVGGKTTKHRCPYYVSWSGILRRAKIAKVEVRPDFAQFENFKKHVQKQEKAFHGEPTTIIMMSDILNLNHICLDSVFVLHRHHRNFFPRPRHDRTLPIWTAHYAPGGFQSQVKIMTKEENDRPRKKSVHNHPEAADAHFAGALAKINNAQELADYYTDEQWQAKLCFTRFMTHLDNCIHNEVVYEPQWT